VTLSTPDPAVEGSFRYLTNLLERRARRLPRELVRERVEQTFRDLCVEVGPTLSLEIGAHEAGFSRWMKSAVPDARVVAFEANPFVHEKFAATHEDSGVEYLHLAVSETNGPVELGIPRQLHNEDKGRRFKKHKANRMASLASHRYAEDVDTVTVPSTPLDDFVSVAGDDVIVAWVDVE
jgi:FkbM family methyltransferase